MSDYNCKFMKMGGIYWFLKLSPCSDVLSNFFYEILNLSDRRFKRHFNVLDDQFQEKNHNYDRS